LLLFSVRSGRLFVGPGRVGTATTGVAPPRHRDRVAIQYPTC